MNRSDLISNLSSQFPYVTNKDIELAVNTILGALCNSLANGNRTEIRGFGSFGLNYRPPRNGRNPKTGESVLVPAKYVPHFRTGRELKERVNCLRD